MHNFEITNLNAFVGQNYVWIVKTTTGFNFNGIRNKVFCENILQRLLNTVVSKFYASSKQLYDKLVRVAFMVKYYLQDK